MQGHPVVTLYETVAETTAQMLEAARAKDWARVNELEAACAEYTRMIVEQAAINPDPRIVRTLDGAALRYAQRADALIRVVSRPSWSSPSNRQSPPPPASPNSGR